MFQKLHRFIFAVVACLLFTSLHGVYYFSPHPGAYHKSSYISQFGESITLRNGSVWTVPYIDRYKLLGWLPTDIIVILRNNAWFSSYEYRFVNQTTGDTVETHLTQAPTEGNIHTHQILSIDYDNSIVYLQDSTWAISFEDESVIYKWLPKDLVIIGINEDWNSSIRPNILINVNVKDFAAASCLGIN